MKPRREAAARLTVKVVPGSSQCGIVGWLEDALKVRVTAPPERGRANAAVVSTIAEALGLAAERVQIVAGHSSARKTIEIAGLTDAEVQARLRGAFPNP